MSIHHLASPAHAVRAPCGATLRRVRAWAAKFGQIEMVKFLLERGAPKSLPDDPPWATPLAWAVNRGHDSVARLLV